MDTIWERKSFGVGGRVRLQTMACEKENILQLVGLPNISLRSQTSGYIG